MSEGDSTQPGPMKSNVEASDILQEAAAAKWLLSGAYDPTVVTTCSSSAS